MVSVKVVTVVLCALVLVCVVRQADCFVLSRVARQSGSQCSFHVPCAFETYDVDTSEILEYVETCTCPMDTRCIQHYNNLATGVRTMRCYYPQPVSAISR